MDIIKIPPPIYKTVATIELADPEAASPLLKVHS
jgi:hypothetical protein